MTFKVLKYIENEYTDFNSYAFNSSGKFPFLQKLCFKLLNKLQANGIQRYKIQTIPYNSIDIVRDLVYHYRNLKEFLDTGQKYKCYIGIDTLEELYSNLRNDYDMTMIVTLDGEYNFNFRGMNLPIIVVPYMKGFLMVPTNV